MSKCNNFSFLTLILTSNISAGDRGNQDFFFPYVSKLSLMSEYTLLKQLSKTVLLGSL